MNEKRSAMHEKRIMVVSLMACATVRVAVVAATIEVSPPRPVGPGSAAVLRPAMAADGPADTPGDLLIHFHGAIDTIRGAMERADTTATVVVVNQPGLSAAYATPFREDPRLFDRLLAEPTKTDGVEAGGSPPRWRHVTLSCFSAGYGAVREILKTEAGFERADAIVAADSIYAGIDETADNKRQVDARDMAGFLAFAEAATAGRKVFVVSHSAQPTPYASTTETADYLLGRLALVRTPVEPRALEEFSEASRARRGGFEVQGFTGASGPAHLFHLRSINRWWRSARELSAAAGSRPGDDHD
ncbi:MAG: hypothetical protein ACKO4T_14600 [Planctomycetaceae bacterium]